MDRFEFLCYKINISKEQQESIKKLYCPSLALYYLIKECGADKDWQEDYDYFSPMEKAGDLIGHSGYTAYFYFQELKEDIQKMIGIKGKKLNYSDYIKECMLDDKS